MAAIDQSSIESVVSAMYRSVSFKQGERPDWTTERLIFDPDVRLVRNSESGREAFDLQGYMRNIESMIADGRLPSFHETEIMAVIDEFGDIGHSFSTYKARASEDSDEILFRGINSIQLMRTAGAWRIVSMIWYREGPATPLPPRYLNRIPERSLGGVR